MEYIEDIKGIEIDTLLGFIKENLGKLPPAQKILVLFPDYSRVDFSHMIAPAIADRYRGSKIDFMYYIEPVSK